MNFYIGNKISDIKVEERNAIFTDDMSSYIYKLRNKVDMDMSVLYKIDPYSDVELSLDTVKEIVKICRYLLDNDLMSGFEDEYAIEDLENVISIGEDAIREGKGLVSIGD